MEATKQVPLEDPRRKSRRKKDIGYYGNIPITTIKNGKVYEGGMSEYSTGSPIFGKETEYPTLAPGLSKKQMDTMKMVVPNKGDAPRDVIKNAADHARKRILQGKSPFYSSKEK